MNEIEDVIEQYKKELVGEAELARDDLQEIEDHLRTLTRELRDSGMSSAEAVRAACVRLGNPRAVAREHAKVHSPFGARLSWARTLSAAALLMITVIVSCVFMWKNWDRMPAPFTPVLMTILSTVLIAALLARLTWARPLVLGVLGYMVTFGILIAIAAPDGARSAGPIGFVGIGIVAFVMPWRRGELYRGGFALVLHAFAFAAMAFAAETLGIPNVGPPTPEKILMPIHMAPAALMGFLPALVAVAGSIMRARWAAWASAFTAVMLFVSTIEVAHYFIIDFHEFEYAREWLPQTSMLFASSIAALIAAVISWRSARSNVGTLRHVLR